jgi:hypothetical protein
MYIKGKALQPLKMLPNLPIVITFALQQFQQGASNEHVLNCFHFRHRPNADTARLLGFSFSTPKKHSKQFLTNNFKANTKGTYVRSTHMIKEKEPGTSHVVIKDLPANAE